MRLLPRRAEEPADDPSDAEGVAAIAADRVAAPKGRPTPKRRDSEPRRGPVTAPKTRKEATQRMRAQAKRPTDNSAQRRQRMLAGDPGALPRRDAGPLRAMARDYADSRRMLSNLLLLLFPLIIVSFFLRTPFINLFILVLFVVVAGEWVLTGRKLMAVAAERGIDTGRTSSVSIGMYAGTRAYLPRRWRVPRPRVSMGDSY